MITIQIHTMIRKEPQKENVKGNQVCKDAIFVVKKENLISIIGLLLSQKRIGRKHKNIILYIKRHAIKVATEHYYY